MGPTWPNEFPRMGPGRKWANRAQYMGPTECAHQGPNEWDQQGPKHELADALVALDFNSLLDSDGGVLDSVASALWRTPMIWNVVESKFGYYKGEALEAAIVSSPPHLAPSSWPFLGLAVFVDKVLKLLFIPR